MKPLSVNQQVAFDIIQEIVELYQLEEYMHEEWK